MGEDEKLSVPKEVRDQLRRLISGQEWTDDRLSRIHQRMGKLEKDAAAFKKDLTELMQQISELSEAVDVIRNTVIRLEVIEAPRLMNAMAKCHSNTECLRDHEGRLRAAESRLGAHEDEIGLVRLGK